MLTVATLALSAAAVAGAQAGTPPFACRANALDKVQRQRQQVLLQTARRAMVGKQELPNGLALSFPADAGLFVQLAEWISLERRCCPFLEFALDWKRDDSVSVRLTGEAGVKQFIAAEMGITID